MATQLEAFRLLIPEFSAISDVDVQKFLDLAPLYIDPERFSDDNRGLALAYQAASLMYSQKQSQLQLSSGAGLIREKEGDLERQYADTYSNKYGTSPKNMYDNMLIKLFKQGTGANILTRMALAAAFSVSLVPQPSFSNIFAFDTDFQSIDA